MRMGKKVLLFLLKVHLLGLLVLTSLRLGLFVINHSFLSPEASGDFFLQLTAFIRGLWFDNVIGCYILIVPLAACLFGFLFGYLGRWIVKPVKIWLQILWSLAIFISIADIPYFQYFFKHINSSIWNWAEYGTTTLGMLFGEPSYYPAIAAVIIIVIVFVLLVNRMAKACEGELEITRTQKVKGAVIGLVLIGLCIFGIRGRTGYNPIKVSAAYYCEDAFLNQLGVNPTFNLLTSTLDDFRPENKALSLMDEAEALRNVSAYYQWNDSTETAPNCERKDANVVVILMESMSANLMGTFGNDKNLTPFLDSLAKKSILFTNCYSAGIHTNHGLFATLYSYPALMERNMMKGTNIPRYNGLPTVLRQNGYRTMFFMTHESQYDNMNAFFRTNGYDEIYSQENYPADKIANNFGVQDDFLFDYALGKLGGKKPFFATLLSISNHPPYVVPQWMKTHSGSDEDRIVEYADYSLQQFFAKASKTDWYKNTIFVLLGDHGKLIGKAENEMPQSYNHIPLIIYCPGVEPQQNANWATQMDVQATVLGMLGIVNKEKNYSIDLLNRQRDCVFYTADDVMGARADDHLYIYRPATKQEFCYKSNRLVQSDSLFAALKNQLFSNLQAMQTIMKDHE